MIDATKIIDRLWQGSGPTFERSLKQAGFDVVILCAEEYQPESQFFDIEVIRAPFVDDEMMNATDWAMAKRAATLVVDRVRSCKNVLTTCLAGRNRSGLVNALALTSLLGWSGERATKWIQMRRNMALSNKAFCEALAKINGDD